MTASEFQNVVWDYYARHKRTMPWRQQPTPYFVMVSELMLQQTQVSRVLPKFTAFVAQFPTIAALVKAPLSQVLAAWNGLGYNRRAKYLWQAAQMVLRDFNGELPQTAAELQRLPGIGPNTAGAILAYAYDKPVVFIETNIRTVFIHHFFDDELGKVPDAAIAAVVAKTLPPESSREWYWALMDYGTHLKATRGNNVQRAAAYRKQAAFKGSRRQIRGQVLRELLQKPLTSARLAQKISDERLPAVLADLQNEGLITCTKHTFHLTDHAQPPSL